MNREKRVITPSRTRVPAPDRSGNIEETDALAFKWEKLEQQGGSGMLFKNSTVDYDWDPPSPELSDEFPVILLRPQKPSPISPSQEEDQIAAVIPVVETSKKKKRRRTGLIGMPKKRVRESTAKTDAARSEPDAQPEIKRRRSRREQQPKSVEPDKALKVLLIQTPPEPDKLQELPISVNPMNSHPNIRLLDLKMPRWFIPPMYQHLQ